MFYDTCYANKQAVYSRDSPLFVFVSAAWSLRLLRFTQVDIILVCTVNVNSRKSIVYCICFLVAFATVYKIVYVVNLQKTDVKSVLMMMILGSFNKISTCKIFGARADALRQTNSQF